MFLWKCGTKRSKLPENLEEREKLIDILVEKENRETILLKEEIENEEGIKFMTIEERYLFFEQRVEEANKILEEIYKCFFFLKKLRKNIKLRWRWLNIIVIMNERSTNAISKSNIKKRQNGERSLEHEVEKMQNLNKKS